MSALDRLETWEGRTIEEWRARWRLPALVALAETGSTNDVARSLAEQGAPAGMLVIAEHQTAGRGRMQRTWADAPGQSLLLSFVLRPDPAAGGAAAACPGTVPLRVGMAVARALRDAAGIHAHLKWPNDVVTADGKLAGILCEAASAAGDTVVIAGIGINVLQRHDDWPPDLRGHAVSVAVAADASDTGASGSRAAPGSDGRRAELMDALAAALRPLFTRPLDPLADHEIREYARIDALRGLDVAATDAARTSGTAAGIASDGALLIRTAAGVRRVTAGTVRTAPHQHSTARMPR